MLLACVGETNDGTNETVGVQHMPVAAQVRRKSRKSGRRNVLFNARRFMERPPQSGAHEARSWRFSICCRGASCSIKSRDPITW